MFEGRERRTVEGQENMAPFSVNSHLPAFNCMPHASNSHSELSRTLKSSLGYPDYGTSVSDAVRGAKCFPGLCIKTDFSFVVLILF